MAVRLRKDRKARKKEHALKRAVKIAAIRENTIDRVMSDQGYQSELNNGRRVFKNIAAINYGATMPEPEIKEGEKEKPKRPTIDAKANHVKVWPNGHIEFIQPKQAIRAPLQPFEALPIGTHAAPELGAFAASHKDFWDKPEKKETAESRRIRTITQSNKLSQREKSEKLRALVAGPAVSHTKGTKIRVSPAEVQENHGEIYKPR